MLRMQDVLSLGRRDFFFVSSGTVDSMCHRCFCSACEPRGSSRGSVGHSFSAGKLTFQSPTITITPLHALWWAPCQGPSLDIDCSQLTILRTCPYCLCLGFSPPPLFFFTETCSSRGRSWHPPIFLIQGVVCWKLYTALSCGFHVGSHHQPLCNVCKEKNQT